jgi:CspA family cold shock protein
MHKGTFKSFDRNRGYGFIQSPELDGDTFAHAKNLHVAPGTCPVAGDQCLFDVEDGPRGPVAINVKITTRAHPEQQAGAGGYIEYAVKGGWRRHSGD